MTTEIKLVYVTTSSKEESLTISRIIVEERLAACANIMEKIHSIFSWEGAIQEAEESVIIFKSHSNIIDNLIQKIKMLHSYECPCISVISIESGNKEFFDWVSGQTCNQD